MRRRQRRLRAWARHERLSIAMALATVEHHSYGPTANAAPRGQTTGTSAREGEVREQYYGVRAQKRPLPGMRPAPLLEERHTVEQRIEHTPLRADPRRSCAAEDGTAGGFLQEFGHRGARAGHRSAQDLTRYFPSALCTIVEQLVAVPTVLTPTRIAVQIAEQIVDTPVPRGCDRRRLQGSLPGQSSTTSLSSGKRISERIMEQIVDFPEQTVEHIVDTSPGVGLGQGSSSSAGPADEDFIGGFSHFSPRKKSAPPRVRLRECLRTRAHGRRRLIRRPVVPTSGC